MDDYLDDPLAYMYNTEYLPDDPFMYDYGVYSSPEQNDTFAIDNPEFYPRSETNPYGYDPASPINLPYGALDTLKLYAQKAGQSGVDALKRMFTKPASEGGGVDWRAVATAAGALGGALNIGGAQQKPTGYQGKIPQYTAVRQAVQPQYDPNRRPGSSGMRYFTDVQYAAPANVGTAQTAAAEQAQGLAALNAQNPAVQAQPAQQAPTLAKGGIVNLQPGGFVLPADVVSHVGNGSSGAGMRTLQSRLGAQPILGRGDGMSDSNRTTIAGRQPAAVAHEEMYLEPRQVQQLGGPERLYSMMDNIRKARTGTTKQGRQINPDQFLPRQA